MLHLLVLDRRGSSYQLKNVMVSRLTFRTLFGVICCSSDRHVLAALSDGTSGIAPKKERNSTSLTAAFCRRLLPRMKLSLAVVRKDNKLDMDTSECHTK